MSLLDNSKMIGLILHKIIFMSRKNYEDIKQAIQINNLRKNLIDWTIIDLNQLSHSEIAQTMNKSSIFLSSNLDEGFSLPSIEAMASGCLVIGYTGKGGNEYFKEEFSLPVPEKDIQQFALKLEEGIQNKHWHCRIPIIDARVKPHHAPAMHIPDEIVQMAHQKINNAL